MAGHLVAMNDGGSIIHFSCDNTIGSYVIITYVVAVLDISP